MKVNKIVIIIRDIVRIALCIIAVINFFNVEKVEFDKAGAEKLLKEIYKPLEDFNKNLLPTENEELLLVPNNIRSEEEFIRIFNKKITERQIKSFYESLIIEKNDKLYVNSLMYIPSIYSKNGKVTKAYIKKRKRFLSHEEEEELVIKEEWEISDEIRKRSNYFTKNDNGDWILEHYNGSSSCGFVDVDHNPWSLSRTR